MAKHNYESGRLNLPFVGHCTFAKSPPVLDWDKIDADIAVLGAPLAVLLYPGGRGTRPQLTDEAQLDWVRGAVMCCCTAPSICDFISNSMRRTSG